MSLRRREAEPGVRSLIGSTDPSASAPQAPAAPSLPTALRLVPMSTAHEGLVTRMVVELSSHAVGIGWIYWAIAEIVDTFNLDDAILVVDDSPFGRQVFRHARRPLHDAWGEGVHFRGSDGLHAHHGEVPAEVSVYLGELARLALKLDALNHAASHDLLTGLLNRRAFDEVLASDAAQAHRYGWEFALVLVDVDCLKSMNDRLGHPAGDDVLRVIGAELRRGLRAGDIAARIGGDEFGLIVAGAGSDVVPALKARLTQAVTEAIPHAGVSFSFGVACAPADSIEPTALLRIADLRLYDAKGVRA